MFSFCTVVEYSFGMLTRYKIWSALGLGSVFVVFWSGGWVGSIWATSVRLACERKMYLCN